VPVAWRKFSEVSRIFTGLAVFTVVLLLAAVVGGLRIGNYNAATFRLRALQQDLYRMQSSVSVESDSIKRQEALISDGYTELEPLRGSVTFHVLLGVLTSLITILVSSVAVTYFIGTSRWCREVVEAYGLDEAILQRSNALKRRAFPPALVTMLAALGIAAFGAAADPGTLRANTSEWVMPHRIVSLVGVVAIAICLWKQARYIAANHVIIQEVLQKVKQLRRDRGLDVVTDASNDVASADT
jgi:hypothetical protein